MRRLLVVVLLLVPLGAGAQEPNWIESYGGPDNDRLRDTVEWGDTLFFAGTKDLGSGVARAWVLATDRNGAVRVDVSYEDAGGRSADIVALALGDGLYAAGNLGSPGRPHDVFVMRLSPAGTIEWQLELAADGDQLVGDLLVLRDGGLVVVGSTRPPGETKPDGWVVRLDARGGLAWQKAYRSDGDDALASALELPNGDLVLAGHVGILKFPDGFQGWILALDSDGDVRWQRGYEIASSDGFSTILRTPGGYTALGSALQLAFFRGDAWILDVNRAGGLLDSRLLGDFEIFGDDAFMAALGTKAGGFIALGNTDTVAGPSSQLFLAEFDNRGMLRWLRQFGGDGFDQATGLARLKGGDLALAGSLQVATSFEGFAARITAVPEVPPTCELTDTLSGSPYEWLPTVVVPVVTDAATSASPVPGRLRVATSTTTQELWCSY